MIRSEVWQNLTTHSGPLSDTARVDILALSNFPVGGLTVCIPADNCFYCTRLVLICDAIKNYYRFRLRLLQHSTWSVEADVISLKT